jgi:hypothetical protein
MSDAGAEEGPAAVPLPEQQTVHEAFRAPGVTGAVEYGEELTDEEAVERRRQELDVVVRGPDGRANKARAWKIESAIPGRVFMDLPHQKAGRMALPHFHHESRSPDGHTFFEDRSGRKARKRR